MMDNKKCCFIICTNDEFVLSECLAYLQRLIIPDGFVIDLITITEASSMTSGYQEAMVASDAKYKIYMHQDVFILNQYFLSDIINIFESDHQIGMIGMIGYENIPENGIMWYGERHGNIYSRKNPECYKSVSSYKYDFLTDGVEDVLLADGFLLATSVDIDWNTEDLKHWHFYDAYQSMYFKEKGYRIVVPNQKYPWCMHDDGQVLNLENYDVYRRMFIRRFLKKN